MSIQIPPDSTGQIVETTSPDGATQRQVVTVGDRVYPATLEIETVVNAAKVDSAAGMRRMQEMASIEQFDARGARQMVRQTVRQNMTDRRGSTGRGSTR